MNEGSPSLWVVMTTVPSVDQGISICKTLVAEQRIACGQVLPAMTSVYCWQGSVQVEPEHLLLLKTPAQIYPDLEQRLRQLHPYDEPEIIALAATEVSRTYLAWALEQTSGGSG